MNPNGLIGAKKPLDGRDQRPIDTDALSASRQIRVSCCDYGSDRAPYVLFAIAAPLVIRGLIFVGQMRASIKPEMTGSNAGFLVI